MIARVDFEALFREVVLPGHPRYDSWCRNMSILNQMERQMRAPPPSLDEVQRLAARKTEAENYCRLLDWRLARARAGTP